MQSLGPSAGPTVCSLTSAALLLLLLLSSLLLLLLMAPWAGWQGLEQIGKLSVIA